MEKELNTLITEGKLKWLPWIGKNYDSADQKILIVGESHYTGTDENSIKKHQSKDYTRIVVDELALKYLTKDKRSGTLFRNLNLALLGTESKKTEIRKTYWDKVCFYNFVQEEMKTIQKRPSKEQLNDGWKSFVELMKILKPTKVLFIGSKVCDEYSHSLENLKVIHTPIKVSNKLTSRQVHRTSKISINENEISLHFIKHTSSFFSWNKWHNILKLNF